MANERYYIAYGSNLNVGQMYARCPGAVPVRKGWLMGWRLKFKGSKTGNYLTIERAEEGEDVRVPVVIYKITPKDEAALDKYEGFPRFYYKKPFKFLKKRNGTSENMDAFAYIMHEDRVCGIPSDYYVRVCREGYDDYGIDESYLDEAIQYTMDHVGCA